MRIAIVANRFPALSQTFVLHMVTGLIDRGHDVSVFARGEEPSDVMHGNVERYRLRERTRHFPRGLRNWGPAVRDGVAMLLREPRLTTRAVARSLRPSVAGSEALTLAPLGRTLRTLPRGEFDSVLSFFGPNGLSVEELRAIGSVSGRTFTMFLGYDLSSHLREHGRDVYRRLFAEGDVMLPICSYFRDKLLDLGCPPEKIAVHHLGIDCESFAFVPRVLSEGEPVRVLSVARMVGKKGLSFALRAIATVARSQPNLEYHIVGDGPLRGELEALIRELGIGHLVTLHGWMTQEQLQVLQLRAHLFLLPSVTAENGDEEGTPTVLIEALAAGMPAVSTLHSGIPEIVEHEESGLLVPERDVDALAAALLQLIDRSPGWPLMGEKGRARMVAEFNSDTLNDVLSRRLSS